MSVTIYLIRHGESEANKRQAFLGQCDLPLTQLGRDQARMTAAFLKAYAPRPDAIYASDLIRAYETAQFTAEQFEMPIIKEKDLREINAGLWENTPYAQLLHTFKDTYSVWVNDIGFAQCDGGERVEDLRSRVICAVTRIAQNHENGTVFLFTHATPIRAFAAYCMQKPLEELKTVPWATNASVTKVVYENGSFQLVEYSRNDFMGELTTGLTSNV